MKEALLKLIQALRQAFPEIIPQNANDLREFDLQTAHLDNITDAHEKMIDPNILVSAANLKILIEQHGFKDINNCRYPTNAVKAVWNIAVRAYQIVNLCKTDFKSCILNYKSHLQFVEDNFKYLDNTAEKGQTYLINIVDDITYELAQIYSSFLESIKNNPHAMDFAPEIPIYVPFYSYLNKKRTEALSNCGYFSNLYFEQMSKLIKKYQARKYKISSLDNIDIQADEIAAKYSRIFKFFHQLFNNNPNLQISNISLQDLLGNILKFDYETDVRLINSIIQKSKKEILAGTELIYLPLANHNEQDEIAYLTGKKSADKIFSVYNTNQKVTEISNSEEYLNAIESKCELASIITENVPQLISKLVGEKLIIYKRAIALAADLNTENNPIPFHVIRDLFTHLSFEKDLDAFQHFMLNADNSGEFAKNIKHPLLGAIEELQSLAEQIIVAENVIKKRVLQFLEQDIQKLIQRSTIVLKTDCLLPVCDDEYYVRTLNQLANVKTDLEKECAELTQCYINCPADCFNPVLYRIQTLNEEIDSNLKQLFAYIIKKFVLTPLAIDKIQSESQKHIVAQYSADLYAATAKITCLLKFIENYFEHDQSDLINNIKSIITQNNTQIEWARKKMDDYGDIEGLNIQLQQLSAERLTLESASKSMLARLASQHDILDSVAMNAQKLKKINVQKKSITELTDKLSQVQNRYASTLAKKSQIEQSLISVKKTLTSDSNPYTLFIKTLSPFSKPEQITQHINQLNIDVSTQEKQIAELQLQIEHDEKALILYRNLLNPKLKEHSELNAILPANAAADLDTFEQTEKNIAALTREAQQLQEQMQNNTQSIATIKKTISDKITELTQSLSVTSIMLQKYIKFYEDTNGCYKPNEIVQVRTELAELMININFANRQNILTCINNNPDTQSEHESLMISYNLIKTTHDRFITCLACNEKILALQLKIIQLYNTYFIKNETKESLMKVISQVKPSSREKNKGAFTQFFRSRSASPKIAHNEPQLPFNTPRDYLIHLETLFLTYLKNGAFQPLKEALDCGYQMYANRNINQPAENHAHIKCFITNLMSEVFIIQCELEHYFQSLPKRAGISDWKAIFYNENSFQPKPLTATSQVANHALVPTLPIVTTCPITSTVRLPIDSLPTNNSASLSPVPDSTTLSSVSVSNQNSSPLPTHTVDTTSTEPSKPAVDSSIINKSPTLRRP